MKAKFILAIAAILAGCGATQSPAPDTISGKTEKQATVYIKDSSAVAKEIVAETDTAGNYLMNTTYLKPPYILKAVYANTSSQFAAASGNGTVNINQASTSLLSIAAAGFDLLELYAYFKIEVLSLIIQALARFSSTLAP